MENIDSEKIMLNTTVKRINLDKNEVLLSNGELIKYDKLINTIPFNDFLKLLNRQDYNKFSDGLTYNKVLVFNLGFNKKSLYNKEHWIYVPNKDINFYRIGFYDNILNTDKLSMYVEIGFPKGFEISQDVIDEQLKLTLKNLKAMKVIDSDFYLVEYESIVMNPAYVHIDVEKDEQVRKIMEEFKQNNIYSIGRYGGWTYCSMEDCMIEAKNLIKTINK